MKEKEKTIPEEIPAVKKASKTEALPKGTPLFYLGADIPGVVNEGTIFKNGVTDAIKAAVTELPVLAELFVSPKQLGAAAKELKDPTSTMHLFYQKSVEYAKERRKQST